MRVLVVGTSEESIKQAAAELSAAGHDVERCQYPGTASFPCYGVQCGERCPLDAERVDVVLDARDVPGPRPMPLEEGAVCAIRRQVPLVVVSHTPSPFARWATRSAAPGAVVEACMDAANAPLTPHGAIAASAAKRMLERAGINPSRVTATVHHHRGRLRVTLGRPPEARRLDTDLVPSVLAALRRYDPHAAGIDVSVDAVG